MKIINHFFILFLLMRVLKLRDSSNGFDDSAIKEEQEDLKVNIDQNAIELEQQLEGILYKIKETVQLTLSGIDASAIHQGWQEGLMVRKDSFFEEEVQFYFDKDKNKAPCKSINFLFNLKSDFRNFEYNAKDNLLCFLKSHDELVKELLSDVIVEGVVAIMKSGYANPVSTFYSNILIVEGPIKIKEEMFAALYEYFRNAQEINESLENFLDIIIKLAFGDEEEEVSALSHAFIQNKGTTLTYFFYDILIKYNQDYAVYVSAYDYIQPDTNLINNPHSGDAEYISNEIVTILKTEYANINQMLEEMETEAGQRTTYQENYICYLKRTLHAICSH